MPRFRFVAVDSSGSVHDGIIEADTEADAQNKLATNGLAVRKVEEISASGNAPAPQEVHRRAVPKSSTSSTTLPPTPARAVAHEQQEAARRRGSIWPAMFSILALIISIATAVYVVSRDPPGGRLSKYDFSTPEAAAMSYARIKATNDSRAVLELMGHREVKFAKERYNTMVVQKTREHPRGRGLRVAFIEYEIPGRSRPLHEVQWFEREPETGWWQLTDAIPNDLEGTQLGEDIAEWLRQGG
jgi:hypothetical protein